MSSIAAVFDAQAAGYERRIRENWDSLEQWERDHYEQFAAWASDKKAVKRTILTPERRGYRRMSAGAVGSATPRTVALSYVLIAVGLFFVTMLFQGAALGLAAVNVARGRWGHGLVQFASAAAAIALYRSGAIAPGETFDAIRDLVSRYR